jgi:cystathionine beta-synthase
MIVDRVTELIGHTPLMEIACTNPRARLFLKLEKFNPGGSMKDRMARGMIDDAEQRGVLRPGGTIVESSSGNTGTGLAMVAAERGYRFIVVVDRHAASDKIRTMRAMGAEVVFVEDDGSGRLSTAEREALAERIAGETPGAVVLRQHRNASNAASYVDTLAVDLLQDVPAINTLVGSVGTGGSLCGTASGIKRRQPLVRVVGVEPRGSIIFGAEGGSYHQSGTGVPPGVEVGTVIDYDVLDAGYTVDDIAAFNTCRFFARRYGLLIGGSAGAVLYAAAREITISGGFMNLVAITGDGGEKYLNTIFDDQWMNDRGLLDLSVEGDLASVFGAAARDAVAA